MSECDREFYGVEEDEEIEVNNADIIIQIIAKHIIMRAVELKDYMGDDVID